MSALTDKLRSIVKVRGKSVPLSDFIRMCQQAADRIDEVEARVAKLDARLEIDHCYREVNGDMVRVELKPEERGRFPDGITCRDATIKLQREHIAELQRKQTPVVYETCAQHKGQPISVALAATPLGYRSVCPHCQDFHAKD